MASEREAAIVNSNVVRAFIRTMGMMAENMQRDHRGESMTYDEQAFLRIIDEESVSWNSVISMLNNY